MIQSHRNWYISKSICNFLLVFRYNYLVSFPRYNYWSNRFFGVLHASFSFEGLKPSQRLAGSFVWDTMYRKKLEALCYLSVQTVWFYDHLLNNNNHHHRHLYLFRTQHEAAQQRANETWTGQQGRQEAQLSQRGRAMPRVVEYFGWSLKAALSRRININMVTFANLGSVRLPSLKFVGLRVRKIRRI